MFQRETDRLFIKLCSDIQMDWTLPKSNTTPTSRSYAHISPASVCRSANIHFYSLKGV